MSDTKVKETGIKYWFVDSDGILKCHIRNNDGKYAFCSLTEYRGSLRFVIIGPVR